MTSLLYDQFAFSYVARRMSGVRGFLALGGLLDEYPAVSLFNMSYWIAPISPSESFFLLGNAQAYTRHL